MASGEMNRLLAFANMQMASEAFLSRQGDATGENRPPEGEVPSRLLDGNFHASKFTPIQAAQFTADYEVVKQYRNDPLKADGSGFSASLFRSRVTDPARGLVEGELTLSFRSVEFVDDAVRDATAAGRLEIKDLGWAFGQIAEMEAWYAELRADPALLRGKTFNVTGYSLGGHLATAFSILRREEAIAEQTSNPVIATYTFNGAGTGAILDGRRLTDLIADFNRIRANYSTSPEWTSLSIVAQNTVRGFAQGRVDVLLAEQARVAGLSGVRNAVFFDLSAPVGNPASLDYQIAALLAAQSMVPSSGFPFPVGTNWLPTEPQFVAQSEQFGNMLEIVGRETSGLGASFVSNSGLHYGTRQTIHIEDQPLARGTFTRQVVEGLAALQLNLLVNDPDRNNFADTHSLVLLVDSLSLMAVFERLDPQFTAETAEQIFARASNARAAMEHGLPGTAEGDTLEKTVDGLRHLLGSGNGETQSDLGGNTWHKEDLRQSLHQNLAALNAVISANNNALQGKFRIVSLADHDVPAMLELVGEDSNVGAAWRYALANLNPFVLEPTTAVLPPQYIEAKYLLFDPTANPNGLTADYLTDRAIFLAQKLKQNVLNLTSSTLANGEAVLFDDRESGYRAYVLPVRATDADKAQKEFDRFNGFGQARFVVFGRDGDDDIVAGRDRIDRLYGGGGTDRLSGAGGADYLEGGEGSDFLFGEGGDRDTLVGGAGDDVLDGGPGDDVLRGGTDYDYYFHKQGEGRDRIYDSDGQGEISITAGGFSVRPGFLTGEPTRRESSNYWVSANGIEFFLEAAPAGGNNLRIVFINEQIVVENFVNGNLNITLPGLAPAAPPPPPDAQVQTEGNDFYVFSASPTGAHVQGLAGHDFLIVEPVASGSQAGSLVEGGSDNDALSGGAGSDRLFVESRDDLQAFQEGTASTVPGLNREVVLGNKGDDLVVGGRGNDWLGGGLGKDIIYGGAGDDVISGSGDAYFDDVLETLPQDVLIFNVHDSALSGEAVEEELDEARAGDRIIRQGLDDQSPLDDKDIVFAGAGNDEVWGDYGDDELSGEAGNDTIRGEAGHDIVFGGDGADVLRGDSEYLSAALHGNDFLDGGSGEDILHGEGGDDYLYGGDDRDLLYGGADDDYLYGEGGNDDLMGDAGDDTLAGGAGNDQLMGGAGNDTYIIEANGGQDTITDNEGANRFVFGPGVSAASLNITRIAATNSLTIQHGAAGNVVTLQGGYADPSQQFEFADGTVYDVQQLLNVATTAPISVTGQHGATVLGGSGNDTLGLETVGTLEGGRGDDTLTVGSQLTTLMFSLGDGDDIVQGGGPNATFVFDEMVDGNSLVFVRPAPADPRVTTPRDLILNYGDAGDSIFITDSPHVIENSYGFNLKHVALLERSGLALYWSGSSFGETVVATKFDDDLAGQEGADTLRGLAGNDTLDGGAGKDTLEGGTGDDTLTGGLDSDTLIGGEGDDRYMFGDNDGVDIVVDNAGTDTIEFGAGITLDDVSAELVNATDGNIYLAVGYAGETVLIRQNFGSGAAPGAIQFHFTEGNTTVSSAELSSEKFTAPLNFVGAGEAIRLTGSGFADTLIGSTLHDRLEGGEGNDQIAGDDGNDFLVGGTGDDLLVGNAGDDTLDGGEGSDTYRFHRGMGKDLVVETLLGALNTLELRDFSADDLAKEKLGDDLYLHAKNSREGVRIQNYYNPGASTSSQSWQVRFSDASTTPFADFLASVSDAELPGDLGELVADFKTRARVFYESMLIASGYQLVDGEYRLDTTVVPFPNAVPQHRVITVDIEDTPGGTPGLETISFDSDDVFVTIHTYPTENSTAVRFQSGGNHPHSSSGGGGATRYFNLQGSQYSGVSYSTGSMVAINGHTVTIDPLTGAQTTRPTEFRVYSGPPPEQITQQIVRTDIVADYRVNISTVALDHNGASVFTSPFSVILGGDGDDSITSGSDISVPLQSWIGEIGFAHAPGSFLYGGAGDDRLRGHNDFFIGGNGDDVLVGGSGDDLLEGGPGNDHYVVFDGDGNDTVYDDGATRIDVARENLLELPAASAGALTATGAQLLWESAYVLGGFSVFSSHSAVDLGWGTAGEGVRIILPHSERNAALGIDYVRLANGEVVSMQELADGIEQDPHQSADDLTLEEGILYGAGGDDRLTGTGLVIGGAGRDTLAGSAGNDILFGAEVVGSSIGDAGTVWDEGNNYRGGEGDDTLWATAGSDIFEFDLGDGIDTVVDMYHTDFGGYGGGFDEEYVDLEAREPAHRAALAAGQDTLRFGPGISPLDITVSRAPFEYNPENDDPGDDLVFTHTPSGAAVRFQLWFRPSVAPSVDVLRRNQLSRVEFESAPTIVWDRAFIDEKARAIDGTDFADVLFGLPTDDVLSGLAGDDELHGGQGDDELDGGTGNDTYRIELESGVDTVVDAGGSLDVISFGVGITPDMLSLGVGSLLIRIGDGGNAIHIEGFDPNDALASGAIERFDFEQNGSEQPASQLTYQQLLARGFDIPGTFADDVLTGTSLQDRIEGFGGNDILSSGTGDDRLDGGSGDDLLQGGAGDDTYVFASFSGTDQIEDAGGDADVLKLGAGITTGLTTVQVVGDFMHLAFGGSRGEVSIRWQQGYRIESVEFFNGEVWNAATLETMAGTPSNPPVNVVPGTQSAIEDTIKVISGISVSDSDAGSNPITMTLTVTNGTIAVNAGVAGGAAVSGNGTTEIILTGAQSAINATLADATGVTYNPPSDFNGAATLTVVSSDGAANDSDPITINVAAVNDAPTLANALLDQSGTEGTPFSYLVPSDSFADVDGDSLTYSASLAGGGALPSWLGFDPTSRTFSGTPPTGAAGAIDVQVSATDNQSPAVSDVFALTIQAGGGAPPINGTANNDTLNGTAGNDTINGLAGSDTLNGLDGNDILDGGAGSDTLNGGNGDDTFLIGGTGTNSEIVNGGSGFDVILGSTGDDTFRLWTYTGANTVERIDGGAGFNVIATVDGLQGVLDLSGTELINIAEIRGGTGHDTITGTSGNDIISSGTGQDYLYGGAGNDTFRLDTTGPHYKVLNGGAGFDIAEGSGGDDTFRLWAYTGANTVERIDGGAGVNVITTVGALQTVLDLSGTELINIARINGDTGDDTVTGTSGNDVISGGAGTDTLSGGAGNDTLDGGAGNDVLTGGAGDDLFRLDSAGDTVIEAAAAGNDTVEIDLSYTLGANVENLTLLGASEVNGTGNASANVLRGNTAANTLAGGTGDDLVNGGEGADVVNGDAGTDVLEGMAGDDTLSDTSGNNYLAGFGGADTLTGASGNDMFVGGAGNDTIDTGAGSDIIAFNRGDGQDTVNASTGQDNTVSLGGSMSLVDLYFRRQANDLVLETGQNEELTLKDWYTDTSNHSVSKLQTVAEAMAGYDPGSADPLLNKKVHQFDFQMMVNAFDQALAADQQLDRWALMNKLLDAHLAGSDTDAIGGDLAYRYGLAGSLAGIGLTPAQTILADSAFGSAPQTLQPLGNLQTGPYRLS